MNEIQRKLADRVGFMQGRCSPLVNGKIQVFPWKHWQNEFQLAQQNGFNQIEWTLDHDKLYENPLLTDTGCQEIKKLIKLHNISIPSLTGDCFMQAPFYKATGALQKELFKDFENIIMACARIGIKSVLIPLVDGGALKNKQQEDTLFSYLTNKSSVIENTGIVITFESDFPPDRLGNFISKFDSKYFGITYDIGNSAALGYKIEDEIEAYGSRIVNVHVKDRLLNGGTVPLGEGDADIGQAIHLISKSGYKGNYILQTARAEDNNHVKALCHYRNMVVDYLQKALEN